MNTTLIARRSATVALATTLASFASLSHADPFTLTAACQLTSLIPGKGQCMLSATLMDNPLNLANVRKGTIKVNGVAVNNANNDSANPTITLPLAQSVFVPCGTAHTVTAFIARQGSSTFEQVGAIPPLACPAAP